MANCEKCDGSGWRDNPKYWRNIGNASYIIYNPRITCRACKGTGYVLADVKDAIDILRVWKNNHTAITREEFKKAIDILEKIFDK